MITPELIEYVKNERARGVNDNAIRQALQIAGGWMLADIEEALRGTLATAPSPNSVEAMISKTNIDHAAPLKTAKVSVDPALKKFRNERKWLVFSVLALAILTISAFNATSGAHIKQWLWMPITALIVAYAASAFTVKIVKPQGSSFKDALMLIPLILLATVLFYIIAGGLALATCLVLGATSGF